MCFNSRKFGYALNDSYVEFYCAKEDYPDLMDNESVYVTGTFNGWLNTGDSSWIMQEKFEDGKSVFTLKKPLEIISVPGNSGFPEFKFFALSKTSNHLLKEDEECENFFLGNKLIFFTKDDLLDFQSLKKRFEAFKDLDDFDMNCPACRAEISNFRLAPGTRSLFRGYHPYKKSRGWMDTENERIELVRKGMELYGIKSDITLSGYETPSVIEEETASPQIEEIEKKHNRLCVNIDYNLVYFHSNVKEYTDALRKISKFMLEHPGPFYIHCRLGSDRTGVTVAIFSSLCGSSWNDIAEDYEKTSRCGIGEFRNRRLLQYSLKNLTGKDPALCDDLGSVMKDVFVRENILFGSEVDLLVKKLNTEPKRKETDFFDFTGHHICAKRKNNFN